MSATATWVGWGSWWGASRRSRATRAGSAAWGSSAPATKAPALAAWIAARGGGVPAIAASDSRQASERATSVVRCSAASAPSA